jgi:hypothetical protein
MADSNYLIRAKSAIQLSKWPLYCCGGKSFHLSSWVGGKLSFILLTSFCSKSVWIHSTITVIITCLNAITVSSQNTRTLYSLYHKTPLYYICSISSYSIRHGWYRSHTITAKSLLVIETSLRLNLEVPSVGTYVCLLRKHPGADSGIQTDFCVVVFCFLDDWSVGLNTSIVLNPF